MMSLMGSFRLWQNTGVPTWRRLQSTLAIQSAQADDSSRQLAVTWEDGSTSKYPYIWLKDNCQSKENFHPVSKSRLMLLKDIKGNSTPKDVHVDKTRDKLNIIWSSGHVSPYRFDWLFERKFEEGGRQSPDKAWVRKTPKTWGKDLKLQPFDFRKLLSNDNHLYNWLITMEEEGITLVKNAPLEKGQVHKICNRIAHPRETNYGIDFKVQAKFDPSNVAYTSHTLGLHTDLPYFHHIPGIQLLHCIKQTDTSGGDNEMADGFHAAEIMRHEHPKKFQLLSTVPINFYDVGVDSYPFFMRAQHTTFKLNASGDLECVAFNNMVRDSYMTSQLDDVEKIYEALTLYNDILYDKENIFNIRLNNAKCLQHT